MATESDKPGVSVTFFAKVMKALPGGGKLAVPIPMLNEWIEALGKIEQDYRSLDKHTNCPKK